MDNQSSQPMTPGDSNATGTRSQTLDEEKSVPPPKPTSGAPRSWLRKMLHHLECKPMELITGFAVILQTVIALLMLQSLNQGKRALELTQRQAEDSTKALQITQRQLESSITQLQIEQETRLNPELECVFNPYNRCFLIRNIGDAPAENIYLKTFVMCVTSNMVFNFPQFRNFGGSYSPPLIGKPILLPSEWADATNLYSPDKDWLLAFWRKFGDDVLVRLYVEYDRPGPTRHRYSGYFNFAFSDDFGNRLLTEEEKPSIQQILERYYATPRAQRYDVQFFSNFPNQWDVHRSFDDGNGMGIGTAVGPGTNFLILQGSWAKHH